MKPKLLILFLLFSSFAHAWKAEGIVMDENGSPLPFVNVFIQGTSIGTVSNEDGAFQLDIPRANALKKLSLNVSQRFRNSQIVS